MSKMIASGENEDPTKKDDTGDNKNKEAVKPDNVPEKFWDTEKGEVRYDDFIKSYSELEKKLSGDGSKNKIVDDPPSKKAEVSDLEIKAKEALDNKGLDMTKYQTEFTEKGELSADSMKELSDKGFDNQMVNTYMLGVQAQADTVIQSAFDTVGGKDNYNKMSQWASENLPDTEVQAFNNTLSGDPSVSKLAITGMYAKYTDAVGQNPNLVHGDNSMTSQGVNAYASKAEIAKAMDDPRYEKDEAYRKVVAGRLSNTPDKVFYG